MVFWQESIGKAYMNGFKGVPFITGKKTMTKHFVRYTLVLPEHTYIHFILIDKYDKVFQRFDAHITSLHANMPAYIHRQCAC